MAPDTNLTDLAHRFADSLNRHDLGALSTLPRDDYVNHNPFVSAEPGAGGALSFFEQWLEALPDTKVVCEDAIAVEPSKKALSSVASPTWAPSRTRCWVSPRPGSELSCEASTSGEFNMGSSPSTGTN